MVILKIGDTFTGKWFTGKVTVKSINEKENILKVTCETNTCETNPYEWPEDWNLAHTISGFKMKEYWFYVNT